MIGFCDCSEAANAQPATWPDRCRSTLRVHWHPTFKTHRAFSGVDFRAVLRQGFDAWEAVIDVRFKIVDDYDAPRSEIFLHSHPFPSSVLADAQLAQNRCDTSLRGRYDTTVSWREGRLFSTLVHEIGHHLGLNHDRSSAASLYYAINADWEKPHARDIDQALRLGYRRATERPDPPKPDRTGYQQAGGAKLIDLLEDQLSGAPLVLMPNSNNNTEIHLGGHSMIRRRPFDILGRGRKRHVDLVKSQIWQQPVVEFRWQKLLCAAPLEEPLHATHVPLTVVRQYPASMNLFWIVASERGPKLRPSSSPNNSLSGRSDSTQHVNSRIFLPCSSA